MDNSVHWEVIKSESVKLGRFETVFETLALDEKRQGYYSFVKFQKNGVCILPILENSEVLLIEQYRRPFDQWLFELPAGIIDPMEEPQDTARRELMEETGLQADSLVPCGFFYPSPGSTNEQIFLFAAHCSHFSQSRLESTEHIRNHIFKKDEIQQLIQENKIYHAAAVILLQKYLLGLCDSIL